MLGHHLSPAIAALVLLGAATAAVPLAAQEPTAATPAGQPPQDARIQAAVDAISGDRIRSTLEHLVAFGTRHTLSDTVSQTRGIGAALRWIHATLEDYARRCDGCLEVSYDPHDVVIQRFAAHPSAHVVNVLARLRGSSDPSRVVVVTGHYDSCICSLGQEDSTSDAPGADDDGSGTAVVLEVARVLSERFPHGLPATIVFGTVAGEEQGLYGSAGLADELAADSTVVVAADMTNDIVGNVHGQKGGVDSLHLRVFAGEPDDGPARQLGRFAAQTGAAYVPDFDVELIERLDRIQRGGDHIPFWRHGYAAVRFSETLENYLHQHRPDDRLEFVSVPYVRRVAQVNAAVVASLAAAPRTPTGLHMTRIMESGGSDWQLAWDAVPHAPDLAGYEVTIRRTTEPLVSRVVPVGMVTSYTLRDTQADDLWIGLRAYDRDGHRSLIASFHNPEAQPTPPAAARTTRSAAGR